MRRLLFLLLMILVAGNAAAAREEEFRFKKPDAQSVVLMGSSTAGKVNR
jgi:hypothetical protein